MNDLLAELAQRETKVKRMSQFLVALPDIKEALSLGYSQAAIYRVLKDQGRFGGSYSFFRELVRNERSEAATRSSPVSRELPAATLPKRMLGHEEDDTGLDEGEGGQGKASIRQELEQFSSGKTPKQNIGWHKRSAKEVL